MSQTRRWAEARVKVLGAAAVRAGTAVLVGLGSQIVLSQVAAANDELAELHQVSTAVGEVRTMNADISGWQTAYAWDTRKVGGSEAVDV
ncbi:hypothetical protein [Cellulomonas sp. NPDC089187]|uniref:hypothetical protein n=1 Tax=Cellulomonas sp. NPDC089187 TaxID=3154970 RepID=UPI003447E7FC